MARVFITGSTDGIGLLAAKKLSMAGHKVLLHARNEQRAHDALNKLPSVEGFVTGDLGNADETKQLASKANAFGDFDAVIHNAGVYQASAKEIFNVNVLAPYLLTCLIKLPERLVYISSDMHLGGHAKFDAFGKEANGVSYSDSKLYVLMLCKAVARKYPGVLSNAVNPGWMPTKMGGKGAPDSLDKGAETQVWLATSNDTNAQVSGRYFFHQKESRYNPTADDFNSQEKLINLCEKVSGISLLRI